MAVPQDETEARPIPSASRDVPTRAVASSGSFSFSFMESLAAAGAIGSLRGREHSVLEHRQSMGRRPSTDAGSAGSVSRSDSQCTEYIHSIAEMGPFNNEVGTEQSADTIEEAAIIRMSEPTQSLRGRHTGRAGSFSSVRASMDQASVTTPLLADGPSVPHPSDTQQSKDAARELSDSVVVGVINTIVSLPCTLAYVAIMFPSKRFRPFMPALSRLVFLGSALHQTTFSFLSSLPFAIGQVQDVGLIFLSAMSTSVASLLPVSGESPEEQAATERLMVTTTLLAMTLSTAVTGLLLIVVGKRRLAGLIAYIPLPVVAGYLGYVGYFCLAAGAAQSSGKPISSLLSWRLLFAEDAWLPSLSGFASFAFIYLTLRNWRHPLCMPTVLCLVPLLYYLVLATMVLLTGTSWADLFAQLGDAGWITMPDAGNGSQPFWEVYELYDLLPWRAERIAWAVLVRQVPMTLALFSVVLFGSCLDITAIQASLPYEVDYNAELVTVGISNLLTGICGAGFTGSYIFSQTIFTMRSGCTHRINGALLAIAEAALFFVPASVIQLLPNFYYGALLLVFGLEITLDWLVFSYSRFTATEYALTLAVFTVIMVTTAQLAVTGLEVGIAVGIVVCALHFAVEYSKVQVRALTAVASISSCVRPYQQRAVLELFRSHIQAMALSGYVFFGSSVLLGDRVRDLAVAVAETGDDANARLDATLLKFPDMNSPGRGSPDRNSHTKPAADGGPEEVPASFDAGHRVHGLELKHAAGALRAARRFLLLDFSGISGMDATAAATFKKMSLTAAAAGVSLVITGVRRPSARWSLLVGNGVVAQDGGQADAPSGTCPCFDTLDDALAWCEAHFLEVAVQEGLMPSTCGTMTLEEVVDMHLGPWLHAQPSRAMLPELSAAEVAAGLERFGETVRLRKGDALYAAGDDATAMFIVLSGEVMCEWDFDAFAREAQVFSSLESPAAEAADAVPRGGTAARSLRYGAGGVTGDLEFFLRQRRSFGAVCTADAAVLRLPEAGYRDMLRAAPLVAVMLQHMVVHNEMHSTASHMKMVQQGAAAVG
eukprot:jgi/Ulvmu1/8560/UM045_0002.1